MKWTTRHDRQLIELWPDTPMPDIARQLGFHQRTVRGHARRLNLPKKSTRNHRYTPIPKATITRLVAEGCGIVQIAQRVGMSRNALSRQMQARMPKTYQMVIDRYGYLAHETRRRNKEQNNDTGTG